MMINPISTAIPTIGQSQTAVKAMVAQGLQQLAMQIYVTLAAKYLETSSDDDIPIDTDNLQRLSKECLMAAQAYFQGLGIAQFQENTDDKA